MKHRSLRHDDGQGLVEYALILVLVAVVVIVILALLGPSINNIFANIVRHSQSRSLLNPTSSRYRSGLQPSPLFFAPPLPVSTSAALTFARSRVSAAAWAMSGAFLSPTDCQRS